MYFFSNGNKYDGNWVDFKMHGRENLQYSNGDGYDGDWLENQKNGYGI